MMRNTLVPRLSFSLAAALALWAAPVAAGSTAFDGSWLVRVVSETGTCNAAYALPIEVFNGQVVDKGFFGASTTGTVTNQGDLTVSIAQANNRVEASGALKGSHGTGRWTSPTLACSGNWVADKI